MIKIKFPVPITKVCNYCVMDTSDPEISFDNEGICNHCKQANILLKDKPYSLPTEEKEAEWKKLISKIKNDGKGQAYDCIIGLSGGVDSTYVAYLVKNAGLKPLAVHLDNGWNSELSVMNIENICKKLDIELFTKVLDWEMYKNLQLAFLRSSTPDSEIPTDHAIIATLFELAIKYKVKYVLTGVNIATESIMPRTWSYGHWDWKYIKNINNRFSKKSINGFPHFGILKLATYLKFNKIKWENTLNYVRFNKAEAKEFIQQNLGWRDYGGKHHESLYTKFFQTYILPRKFGIDKRKAHLSALICSKQISREDAILELEKPIITEQAAITDREYIVKKFGLSDSEFEDIMKTETRSFYDYPNSSETLLRLNNFRKKLK